MRDLGDGGSNSGHVDCTMRVVAEWLSCGEGRQRQIIAERDKDNGDGEMKPGER